MKRHTKDDHINALGMLTFQWGQFERWTNQLLNRLLGLNEVNAELLTENLDYETKVRIVRITLNSTKSHMSEGKKENIISTLQFGALLNHDKNYMLKKLCRECTYPGFMNSISVESINDLTNRIYDICDAFAKLYKSLKPRRKKIRLIYSNERNSKQST